MEFCTDYKSHAAQLVALFANTFTDSEGASEGQLIGKLAQDLLATTRYEDLFVFASRENGTTTGCIIFSRLTYPEDERTVFILAPVAVATRRQGQGIGQRLLRFGLDDLRSRSIDVAITYGAPDYYAKVGFMPITGVVAAPPFKLKFPHGWLAQSLTDRPLGHLRGPSRCVPALASQDYW